tara:strand:- start:2654 stop:3013 length:360 start_codon:yes stop_codon:yes gene_type:complete
MDIQTIKKRRDFLKGNNAPYAAMPSVVVQSYVRTDDVVETDESVMMGITCSKKVGNAVMRNRAKRRLREAGKIVLKEIGEEKTNYIFIARKDTTVKVDFTDLCNDIEIGIKRICEREIG